MTQPRKVPPKTDLHSYVVVRKRVRGATDEYVVGQIPQLVDKRVAIFCGPKAKQFAAEYAAYKNALDAYDRKQEPPPNVVPLRQKAE